MRNGTHPTFLTWNVISYATLFDNDWCLDHFVFLGTQRFLFMWHKNLKGMSNFRADLAKYWPILWQQVMKARQVSLLTYSRLQFISPTITYHSCTPPNLISPSLHFKPGHQTRKPCSFVFGQHFWNAPPRQCLPMAGFIAFGWTE